MKKIWKMIRAKSSPENRRNGQIWTVAAGSLEGVAAAGYVDEYPKLKLFCHIGAFVCGLIAADHALKTADDLRD